MPPPSGCNGTMPMMRSGSKCAVGLSGEFSRWCSLRSHFARYLDPTQDGTPMQQAPSCIEMATLTASFLRRCDLTIQHLPSHTPRTRSHNG